jgi:hypothetical protein
MDTKNGVLLMPLVSPRRPIKQQSTSGRWLFVCTLAGLAAGFSLGLCCGFFASPKSTAGTAHYLSAPLPQHAVIEEFIYVTEPSYSNPAAAVSAGTEAAVAAVPAAAAAAAAGPAEPAEVALTLPELPAFELYHTPAAGVSHYHGKYFSQTGQDDLIDELLDMQQGGFFVE